MAKIIILGDLYPNKVKNFPEIPENDFCVANLECAITSAEKGIKKDGPSLKIDKEQIQVLKELGVNLVGLANNHILDFGYDGLKDTLSALDKNNIKYAGISCGANYYVHNVDGHRFGFYFVSEHQYNNLTSEKVSVNLLEEHRVFEEIKSLKEKCDSLIVLFHGGKEYYKYPTPAQQLTCYGFVDSGADVVICQHSHCVGCRENYNGSTIIFGQGDFMFPFQDICELKSGLIIQLEFRSDKKLVTSYLPIVHKETDVIRYANEEEAKEIIEGFDFSSKDLKEKTAEVLYQELVDKTGIDFLYRLFNKGKLYIRLDTSKYFKNRMLKRYIKKNRKYILYLYNYFNCEVHREYIMKILSSHIEDFK